MSILTLALAATVGGQLVAPAPHTMVGARSLALSPDGSQIAFSYRGDLWVAASSGGKAIPVTNNVEMDDNPVWSPDGKWVAFASDRSGNWDVYAVPVEGGESVRMTYFSGTEIPTSWTPDGKEILVASSYEKGAEGIYRLDVNTLRMREVFLSQFSIDMPMVTPGGTSAIYQYKSNFPYYRARYSGSAAGQIWEVNLDGSGRKKLFADEFQHLWAQPNSDGSGVLAVSVSELTPSSHKVNERPGVFTDSVNRTPNVYEYKGGKARRLTSFVGAGPRFLTVSKSGKMAYEVDGKIFVGDSSGQKPVEFYGVIDPKTGTSERLILTTGVENGTLSPDNKTFIFQIRRELWSVPVTKGKGPNGADAVQLTAWAGSDEEPMYVPDGKSIFFTSDRDDAKALYKMELATQKVTLVHQTGTDIEQLALTPDRKSVSYWVSGLQGGLFMVPVEGGTPKRVIDKPWKLNYAFSPDMKYVAYVKPLSGSGFKYWENGTNIWLREVGSGMEVNVTRQNTTEDSPSWSADGKYLYFASSRQGGGLYLLPMQKEEARSTDFEMKWEKPSGPVKVEFDGEGVENRIRRLVSGAVVGPILSDAEKGDVYYQMGGDIWKVGYDGEGGRAVTSGGGVTGLGFSLDGNLIGFTKGGGAYLLDIRKPNIPTSQIEFRADWIHDLVGERKAAFHEFWRAYNLNFYDDSMHQRDWRKIRNRYESLLDAVAHRREMATVLNEMVGELESSHSEVGPSPGGVSSEQTAHLGFTIDYSYGGPGLKIKDVPANSPGSYSKTKLLAGEYVMAVNGVDVTADQNLFKVLNQQAGRDVTLHVNSVPSRTGSREVKYRALSGGQFSQILYQNRIDWRRNYVEQKSGGRLTYVHIAGMGGGNLETFNREMWEYVQGKEGAIIDVRENGGGNIADVLIDALERRPQMQYLPRSGELEVGPGQAWGGHPTVVMHAETSFSNAEMFPASMKTLGLAELVGMPTPGYVIYTYGGRLVDGTSIRLPAVGVYRMDGTPTENIGQKPDYQVDIAPSQYFNNQDPQLDKAIEVLMKKLKR